MSNELRLLKAFIEAQGYEIEELLYGKFASDYDYKVTKKKKGQKTPIKSERFGLFWKSYPRKEAKPAALSAFERLTYNEQGKAIDDCIQRYKDTEKQFIPHASTYLNQKRFNDEQVKSKPKLPGDDKLATFAKNNGLPGARMGESFGDYRRRLERHLGEQ